MDTPDETGCERYEIHLLGRLDDHWLVWPPEALLSSRQTARPGRCGQPVTVLVVRLADQAQLRGLLNRLWDLNLTLLAVRRLDAPAADTQNSSGWREP